MAGGRKGKYYSHVEPKLLLNEAWARDGPSIEQIAEKLGIANSTFFDYKNKHSELSDALKKGQEVNDVMVENALFKSAIGYQYVETTKERIVDGGQRARRPVGSLAFTEADWQFAVEFFLGECCYCGGSHFGFSFM